MHFQAGLMRMQPERNGVRKVEARSRVETAIAQTEGLGVGLFGEIPNSEKK